MRSQPDWESLKATQDRLHPKDLIIYRRREDNQKCVVECARCGAWIDEHTSMKEIEKRLGDLKWCSMLWDHQSRLCNPLNIKYKVRPEHQTSKNVRGKKGAEWN